jgi:hypothetical protein
VTRVKDEMAKVWVLDTETKGTGAHVVPLEKALKGERPEDEPRARPRKRQSRAAGAVPSERSGAAPRREPAKPRSRRQSESGPLPPGHVRKKATGEIGRIRSVDAKAGTATVLWLKQGRSSTVPLTAISRR